MNKYLPHAYILKRTKSIKELYTQEHKKNKGKPTVVFKFHNDLTINKPRDHSFTGTSVGVYEKRES